MPNIIKETSRGYEPLAITDLLLSERKVFITDEISPALCNSVIQQLMMLDSESHDEITVYINSPGGSVIDGLALYEVMRMIKSPVKTFCMGHAASMGAILFLAGDKRCILKRSEVMIHDPSYGGGRYTGQKPHEIQQQLDSLVKKRDILVEIIAERTGNTVKSVRRKTATDSYFTADEALEYGLATEIAETIS